MTTKTEMVEIPKEVYKRLIRKELILETLYANGVDNWEWYGDAISEVPDDE